MAPRAGGVAHGAADPSKCPDLSTSQCISPSRGVTLGTSRRRGGGCRHSKQRESAVQARGIGRGRDPKHKKNGRHGHARWAPTTPVRHRGPLAWNTMIWSATCRGFKASREHIPPTVTGVSPWVLPPEAILREASSMRATGECTMLSMHGVAEADTCAWTSDCARPHRCEMASSEHRMACWIRRNRPEPRPIEFGPTWPGPNQILDRA